MNNLSLMNIFGETGQFFYNINYMLNSEHLSLVNKIGDKTEFTITRVHCNYSRVVAKLLVYAKLIEPKLIFFNEKKNRKILIIFGVEN